MKVTPFKYVVAAVAMGCALLIGAALIPATVHAQTSNVITVPDLAPLPPPPFADARKANIGRQMFWDKLLAADGQQGCVLCHNPEFGWAHDKQISPGYPGTLHFRNAQSVVNSVYRKEHGQSGIWGGVDAAIQYKWSSPYFLARDGRLVVQVWRQFPWYMNQWKEVYGHMPSFPTMKESLGNFVKTLTSRSVPLDAYLQGNEGALSAMAKNGMELFKGKARCILCHNGALLSDESYHNLMVPENPILEQDPLMLITRRFEFMNLGTPGTDVWCRGYVPMMGDEYQPQPCTGDREFHFDAGRFTVTKEWKDLGKFKSAMLRDVSRTPPYMHNGMIATLSGVIDFYNQGGGPMWQPNVHFAKLTKDPLIKPLGLTSKEKADLLAFLEEGLTGTEITVEAPEALPPPPVRRAEINRIYETNWVYKHSDKYGKGEAVDTLHGHK